MLTLFGKNEESSTPASADPSEINPGITLLKVLIIVILCIIVLSVASFAVEAWMGTLDTRDLSRFMLKAAFGLALIGNILRKIKNRSPF
jgi:Tfp pilus assembly protein PilV